MEHRKKTTSTERSNNYLPRNHSPTYSPSAAESRNPRPTKISKNLHNHRQESRYVNENTNKLDKNRPKSKFNPLAGYGNEDENNLTRRKISVRKKTENYIEKDGTLLVPKPTPYFYNEKTDVITEDPESETKKVNVKEYRNRVESLKLSELKHFHPEGSVQFVNYERHL